MKKKITGIFAMPMYSDALEFGEGNVIGIPNWDDVINVQVLYDDGTSSEISVTPAQLDELRNIMAEGGEVDA